MQFKIPGIIAVIIFSFVELILWTKDNSVLSNTWFWILCSISVMFQFYGGLFERIIVLGMNHMIVYIIALGSIGIVMAKKVYEIAFYLIESDYNSDNLREDVPTTKSVVIILLIVAAVWYDIASIQAQEPYIILGGLLAHALYILFIMMHVTNLLYWRRNKENVKTECYKTAEK